jgi:hypothetical protein
MVRSCQKKIGLKVCQLRMVDCLFNVHPQDYSFLYFSIEEWVEPCQLSMIQCLFTLEAIACFKIKAHQNITIVTSGAEKRALIIEHSKLFVSFPCCVVSNHLVLLIPRVKAHYGVPLGGVTLYYFSKMCMFECIPVQTFKKNSQYFCILC